jgi:DNA-binding response OmpR family regulator
MTGILRTVVNRMKRLLGSGKIAASSSASPAEEHSSEIRLLAITASAREQNTIRVIAVTHGWKLRVADSVKAALNILAVEPGNLILYDRDLPGIEWQYMFRILLSEREPQCVILASPVTDDYLWQAVIERGGYDVITKPFQEEKVVHVVRSAWLYQKAVWGRQIPRLP